MDIDVARASNGRFEAMRMEIAVAVGAKLKRLPNLRLDFSGPRPEIAGFAYRGPLSVPVVWDVTGARR
jgi:hypothetical protein